MTELFKNLLSFKKAKGIMLKSIKKNKTEIICIENSEDRILAENIYSKIDIPEFDNSAVDGFGFINSEKTEKELKLVGESKPGKPFKKEIKSDEAIRVYTGAYLLKNLNKVDTVCMEEDSILYKNTVKIKGKMKKGTNIRVKGEDIKKNRKIFSKGRKLRSVDLAQLSSVGVKKIKVFKKIKVGIFSSGDELCNLKERKPKYKIFDANKLALISLFKKIGCEVVDFGIIEDDYNQAKKKIFSKLSLIDVLITSGGVSKSNTDQIGKVFEENGIIDFWRLSIKPGRPFAFGKIRNTPFIGLPGNPVAAVITFFMLVVDYIKLLSGLKENDIIERVLPCDFELKKKKGRTEWLRGKIIKKNNSFYLSKFSTTGSGIISSLSQSQGVIELDEKIDYIKKGTLLKFFRYEDMLN